MSEEEKKNKSEIQYVQIAPQGAYTFVEDDDDIDILVLARTIWDGKKLIGILMAVFFLIGLFYISTGPEEYESEAILLQEAQQPQASANLRLLQQLGGVGGTGGGGDPGTLSATLYPKIIESVEFQHNLLTKEVMFENLGRRMTLYEFFTEEYEPPFRDRLYIQIRNYTVRLPITLYRNFRSLFRTPTEPESPEFSIDSEGNIMILNSHVRRAISQLRNRVAIEFEMSFITVNARLPDARAAAELNALLIEQIQEYVIGYRSEKARQNLEFVQQQYEQFEKRYEAAQRALAQFQDGNHGVMTALARLEQQRLENEQARSFSLYSSATQNLEGARLRLQEETPVFTQLQKPNLPHSPAGSSNVIMIVFTFFGAIIGVSYIFGKKIWDENKERFFNS